MTVKQSHDCIYIAKQAVNGFISISTSAMHYMLLEINHAYIVTQKLPIFYNLCSLITNVKLNGESVKAYRMRVLILELVNI